MYFLFNKDLHVFIFQNFLSIILLLILFSIHLLSKLRIYKRYFLRIFSENIYHNK